MNLIIDIGNTRVKTALFNGDEILEVDSFTIKKFGKKIKAIHANYSIKKALISSVGNLSKTNKKLLASLFDYLELDQNTKVPFINKYATPQTLGVDRIALAAAASCLFPKRSVLIIDVGTCITYDFINANNEYLGGAIAPGVLSRYKSLHDYTENLPLLNLKEPQNFIGDTTEESLHSGVVNGICREIDGVISQYKESFGKLTVVLTGGDAKFLSSQLKSSIFVEPFFLVKGLNTILKNNI
ncbi:MAG TPA: type III pantothenate kinase [Lutibacter sp.]|nr:type III pantothenate kinase [Lutibacter sp.]